MQLNKIRAGGGGGGVGSWWVQQFHLGGIFPLPPLDTPLVGWLSSHFGNATASVGKRK